MQGMIISNPKLEFLRPALERWFDCIDRYNAVRGDNETPLLARRKSQPRPAVRRGLDGRDDHPATIAHP
jgi:hypothetical protein